MPARSLLQRRRRRRRRRRAAARRRRRRSRRGAGQEGAGEEARGEAPAKRGAKDEEEGGVAIMIPVPLLRQMLGNKAAPKAAKKGRARGRRRGEAVYLVMCAPRRRSNARTAAAQPMRPLTRRRRAHAVQSGSFWRWLSRRRRTATTTEPRAKYLGARTIRRRKVRTAAAAEAPDGARAREGVRRVPIQVCPTTRCVGGGRPIHAARR